MADNQMTRNLTPLSAWAFSIGTSIGWGSLIVTSNTYLAKAGPLGSTFGMLIGCAVMLIISVNYAYMMNIYPNAGGAYTFTKQVFGHDYGFLTAWFLSLTYLAILWANATSVPLFARYFVGDIFQKGRMYAVFGYDVYFGEAILSIAAIMLIAFLCSVQKRIIAKSMIVMALLFTAGIIICFVFAIMHHGIEFYPEYAPSRGKFSQIIRIAVISPWAFIGFESISHASEETVFPRTRYLRILIISVVSTTALYIFVTLLSATAYPKEFDSWFEYIMNIDNLEGLEGLPAFYAADHYMGKTGVGILMAALLALILTSLVGNITALSRLFCSLARDRILPERFARLNRHSVPGNAIWLIAATSVVFPFIGRTAIGWIVDVTTFGATLIYGLVSGTVVKRASERRDKGAYTAGILGVILMIANLLYLLIPNLFTSGSMERESYFLFVIWSLLGFVYFRVLLQKDRTGQLGRSIVVWISLFSLIVFVALVWLYQSIIGATSDSLSYVEKYYVEAGLHQIQTGVVSRQLDIVRQTTAKTVSVVVILLALSLIILIGIFRIMRQRAQLSEVQLGQAKKLASTDPLTGVKNRTAFAERERLVDEQISAGTSGPFGIVVCDLNGLKYINDTYGHQTGDEWIRKTSKIICDFFSHSPVYRNGGDEFVVFLSGRDFENRIQILSDLHQQSVDNIATNEAVIAAGFAEYVKGTDSKVHAVFARADAAMYKEKMLLKGMGAKSGR